MEMLEPHSDSTLMRAEGRSPLATVPFREGRQLHLFENPETAMQLDRALWYRSFAPQVSSLHSLAPYPHRISATTAQVLIDLYSQPGDVVLDPFARSGTIAFEAAAAGRIAWANDLSPYAQTLTAAKLAAPPSRRAAQEQAIALFPKILALAPEQDLSKVPTWVQEFFHPNTLREILAAVAVFQAEGHPFLLGCLLGILHHTQASALSYPSRSESPYLRRASYPPEQFPERYAYREVRSRLLAKIQRLYRRPLLSDQWAQRHYRVWQHDGVTIPLAESSIDAIITHPPHPGAFSYLRDQRLRLYFLGHPHWQDLEAPMVRSRDYPARMATVLTTLTRLLKPGGWGVLVFSPGQPAHSPTTLLSPWLTLVRDLPAQPLIVRTIYEAETLHRSRSPHALPAESILVLQRY